MTGEHAVQRAFEHYAVVLTLRDLVELERQIRDAHAPLLTLTPHGNRYRVKHKGTRMIAVWRRGRIVTFLAPHVYNCAEPPTLGDIWPITIRLASLPVDPSRRGHAAIMPTVKGEDHEEGDEEGRQTGGEADGEARGREYAADGQALNRLRG